MFGQLQSEPITAFNKESQLEESYSSLVDLIPRVQDVQRLSQIPRLSKFRVKNTKTNLFKKYFSKRIQQINGKEEKKIKIYQLPNNKKDNLQNPPNVLKGLKDNNNLLLLLHFLLFMTKFLQAGLKLD